MSNDPTPEPLRGDAKWRATKDAINKRNDAARARGAEQRAADDAKAEVRRINAARLESTNLPVQPEP